jgi:hypothetical protein
MSSTACTFSRLASIPRPDTTKPRNFPEDTSKAHLRGFKFAHIDLHVLPYLFSEHFVHQMLVYCYGVFQSEWHELVAVKSPVRYEAVFSWSISCMRI